MEVGRLNHQDNPLVIAKAVKTMKISICAALSLLSFFIFCHHLKLTTTAATVARLPLPGTGRSPLAFMDAIPFNAN